MRGNCYRNEKNICIRSFRITRIRFVTTENVNILQRIYSHNLRETTLPTMVLTDNKSVTGFFQANTAPPTLWNACDYVLKFNLRIMNVAGSQNTAADFLSILKLMPKEKVQLKIRDKVLTSPKEVNHQSSDVVDDKQFFFLPDEEEESEQDIFARKELSKNRAQ